MISVLDRQLRLSTIYQADATARISPIQVQSMLQGSVTDNTGKQQSGPDFESLLQMNQSDEIDEKQQDLIRSANYGPFSTAGRTYFDRAENGVIQYNGVTIACDKENLTLSIGDISKGQDVFMVNLTGGIQLKVNRKNMDSIGKVIGMFSPQDQKLIVNAILVDKQIKKAQYDMDEEKMKIGLTDSQE